MAKWQQHFLSWKISDFFFEKNVFDFAIFCNVSRLSHFLTFTKNRFFLAILWFFFYFWDLKKKSDFFGFLIFVDIFYLKIRIDFWDFWDFFVYFQSYQCLLLKVAMVTTEQQKWRKISTNHMKSSFVCLKGKQCFSRRPKTSAGARSKPAVPFCA